MVRSSRRTAAFTTTFATCCRWAGLTATLNSPTGEAAAMYAVVGCRDCGAYWVVEGTPETTRCPRCATRHRFTALHRFAEAEDLTTAREARSRIIRERAGADDADIEDIAAMEDQIETAGLSDTEFLAASGIDPEATEEAGERAVAGPARKSRREVLMDGLRALETPTEEALVAYAAEYDVPASYVRTALERLQRQGAVSESDGEYRLL